MSAFKAIFLLSLLAVFLAPRETEAQATIDRKWSKFGQCVQVGIEAVTNVADKLVSTLYDLEDCTGYVAVAPKNGQRTVLWYLMVSYEFLKKLVLDSSTCLVSTMNGSADQINPYFTQMTAIGCFNEDELFN